MIRAWKRKPQPASSPRLLFELTTSIFYWKIQRFAPNLTFKPSPNTAPATKSDTWTSPSTAPATKSDTWTSPSTAPATKSDTGTSPNTAPATKSDTWTSPNTAPVTQKDSHSESSSLMNLISNARSNRCPYPTSPNTAPVTKNDTARFKENLQKQVKHHFQCGDDPSMIRPWSEHENANRNPPRHRGYFSSSPSIFYWKIQRFAPNLTFKPSPNTAPATKSTTSTSRSTAPATKSDTWTSPSTAPATKSDTWTSPKTAPATVL